MIIVITRILKLPSWTKGRMQAAAAFAVLSAPHPTTGFTQPVMHTSNSTATIYTLLGSIAAAAASHISPTPPRPDSEQGGAALPL
jgi:hypothetical protein